jgi:hypothetical protein
MFCAVVFVLIVGTEVCPKASEALGAETHAASLDEGVMFNKLPSDFSIWSGKELHTLRCPGTGIPIDKFSFIEKAKLVPISDATDQPSLNLAVGSRLYIRSTYRTAGYEDTVRFPGEQNGAAIMAYANKIVTARLVEGIMEYIDDIFTDQKLRVRENVLRSGTAIILGDYFITYLSVPFFIETHVGGYN